MNIKKMSLLLMVILLQINHIDAAAGEENQMSFRSAIISSLRNSITLREGFDLIGESLDDFLENQEYYNPEEDETLFSEGSGREEDETLFSEGSGREEDERTVNARLFLDASTALYDATSRVIDKAHDIIIKRMQQLLEKGFQEAINNNSSLDDWTMRVFDFAIGRIETIGKSILNHLANIPSLLMNAARSNNTEIVYLLISIGVNLSARHNYTTTALFHAANHGNIEMLRMLINAGINVNHQDEDGNNALIAAARRGDVEVVRLLIDGGVYIDHKNLSGFTALMSAVRNMRAAEVVDLLITEGANTDFLTPLSVYGEAHMADKYMEAIVRKAMKKRREIVEKRLNL